MSLFLPVLSPPFFKRFLALGLDISHSSPPGLVKKVFGQIRKKSKNLNNNDNRLSSHSIYKRKISGGSYMKVIPPSSFFIVPKVLKGGDLPTMRFTFVIHIAFKY